MNWNLVRNLIEREIKREKVQMKPPMDVPEIIFASQTRIEFISANSLPSGGSINFGIAFICCIVCKAKIREILLKLGDIDAIHVITVP